MKRALRTKSVGTKVSEAELRVLESRAAAAGLTLSEWVRDVLLASSVDTGTMAAERAILAEMLAMRADPFELPVEAEYAPADHGAGEPGADRVGGREQDEACDGNTGGWTRLPQSGAVRQPWVAAE